MAQESHSPTLNTILMVEKVLSKNTNSIIKIPQLKKLLPKQINHVTLMTILSYLEESNKIATTIKGITWIHNTNTNLKKAVAKGLQI